MTTAVLVDDEPNLTRYLTHKLSQAWPELEIVGTAVNGRQALALCEELAPDIVFLDIQMPGLNGLQVAEALDPEIRVVFVTAYDDYAVEAFETAAVDYLMKPVEDGRLARTVARLKESHQAIDPAMLSDLIGRLSNPASKHMAWLRCQQDATTRLVPVDSVVYFRAEGKYTSVFTATEEHLIRMSISELEAGLDPDRFWRIHRSIIVRVDEVLEARRGLRGRYDLTLRSRPEQLRTSQKYGHLFRGM